MTLTCMSTNNKIIAIIAARMDSKRFPGKMTRALCGDPLLGFVIDRVKRVRGLKHIVVATTARSIDAPLSQVSSQYGVDVYKGNMDIDNVALRFLNCAKEYQATYLIRINGDSPCIDTELIEEGISYCGGNYDLITNILGRTFPYGISLEIIKTVTFESAYPLFSLSEKEHITSYFYRNKEFFSMKEVMNATLRNGFIDRFTVDTPEDLRNLNVFFQRDKNRKWC